MKNYISSVDLAMWIALIVGQVVLCLCIWKKRFLARLRWFSILYIGNYIESALVFLTLIECGRQVLPGLNLPQKEKALACLLAALGAVIIFAALWPLRSIANEKRIEVGAYLAVGVVFIFIAAYSRYLGLYWSRLLAGITATLGLLYLVEGAMEAITGHYPSAMVLQVRQINGLANILAYIAWIVVILSPWGERVMTEQDLKQIEDAFARIEASIGVGRS
jgi:hypothetical protein